MWRKRYIILVAGVLVLAALLSTLVGIQAASDAPAAIYAIPWWTVDSGGGISQGSPYTLSGTAGQPEPGSISGGNYLLKGGFWSGLLDYRSYLSVLFR
jgi:hypothetical protein